MLDDFREWLSDNLRYILLGLAVILIVVIGFCVVKLVTGDSSEKQPQNQTVQTEGMQTTENSIVVEDTGAGQDGAGTQTQQETAAVGTSSLVKDDTAILTLVKKYYNAAAQKDITTLQSIVDPWNDEVKESVLQNDIIESYENISTYSKKGPVDKSYVVFAYYEGKVANINTLVPSLSMLYLTTSEDGSLVVSDRSVSQEVADYIETVRTDADVQALVADVDEQCENAKASDPALKEFMDSLTSGAVADEGGQEGTTTAAAGEMVVTAGVLNIRQEPNTSAALMGVVTEGTTVTVNETVEDGWCQITYNSSAGVIEGYVKLEYLAAPTSTGDGTV